MTIPPHPIKYHGFPGACSLKDVTASFCPRRPIINSAMSTGKPIKNVHKTNNKIKTLPPLVPAIYGNFQMAPSPIALPAAAKIKPPYTKVLFYRIIFITQANI